MESKVTVTTLRFTDEELDKIDAVTGSGSKTRSGKLRYMINQYSLLEDEVEQLQILKGDAALEIEKLKEYISTLHDRHEKLREIWGTINTILS